MIFFFFFCADDGIFKAGEDRSEMWGASEVQEDENTKVEVPVDQVICLAAFKLSNSNEKKKNNTNC